MVYNNNSDEPTTTDRVFSVTAIDANNTTTSAATFTVGVIAENDKPVIELVASSDVREFIEVVGSDDGNNAVIVNPGITLSDRDSAALTKATVTISNNFEAGDALSVSVTNLDPKFTVSSFNATGSASNGVPAHSL